MKVHELSQLVKCYEGDALACLREMPSESVNCVVTSPPYWGLRDYGCEGQIGLEATPQAYIERMVGVFAEIKRVLCADGTIWVNMGDCYNAHPGQRTVHDKAGYKQQSNRGSCEAASRNTPEMKAKDLVGMPWMLAFALRADGWYLRSDIIWHKPNPMPESVTDRPTKSHEYLFLLSKSERYHYDQEAIAEDCTAGNNGSSFTSAQDLATKPNLGMGPRADRRPKAWDVDMGSNRTLVAGHERKVKIPGGWDRGAGGHGTIHRDGRTSAEYQVADVSTSRNKRTVWTVATQAFPEAHFATFPEELIKPCILAGCPAGGTVLDPFFGSGTTGLVAQQNGCKAIGIELNPDYIAIAKRRLSQEVLQFDLGSI